MAMNNTDPAFDRMPGFTHYSLSSLIVNFKFSEELKLENDFYTPENFIEYPTKYSVYNDSKELYLFYKGDFQVGTPKMSLIERH